MAALRVPDQQGAVEVEECVKARIADLRHGL
jgi:hypothetical protein